MKLLLLALMCHICFATTASATSSLVTGIGTSGGPIGEGPYNGNPRISEAKARANALEKCQRDGLGIGQVVKENTTCNPQGDYVLCVSVAVVRCGPSSQDPTADVCGLRPNGNCLTGDTIGDVHTTDRCLTERDAIARVERHIKEGLCEPVRGKCRLEPNGNCLTGLSINGVHFTNRCLTEDKAFSYFKQFKKIGLCR